MDLCVLLGFHGKAHIATLEGFRCIMTWHPSLLKCDSDVIQKFFTDKANWAAPNSQMLFESPWSSSKQETSEFDVHLILKLSLCVSANLVSVAKNGI